MVLSSRRSTFIVRYPIWHKSVKMKKILLLIFLIFISLENKAPIINELYVVKDIPVKPFKSIIYAIGVVESSLDTMAYNPREEAIGYFQIRQVRIDDYNKRTGEHFKLIEMFEYDKAERVFLYYCRLYDDVDEIILQWNCWSQEYLKKVKKYL